METTALSESSFASIHNYRTKYLETMGLSLCVYLRLLSLCDLFGCPQASEVYGVT